MPGSRAVVVTDGDRALAERLRDELLDRAWVEREAFVYEIEPLTKSVARAKAMPPRQPGEGPVVLLDHYDNCASGGTMDTTVVLAEILRQGLDDVAAFAIYDPAAVQQAIAAGIGARGDVVDRRQDRDAGDPGAEPAAERDRRVKTISNGRYRNRGPMARGVEMDMGPAVVLDTGPAEIVLISRHVEPSDLNCLLEPRHRPDAKALRHAEEPHPLARRARQAGESRRRLRRGRRVHFGLRTAEFPEGQTADLPARPAQPLSPWLVRSAGAVRRAGRDRQPAAPFGSLAALGGAEQPAVNPAGTVVVGGILISSPGRAPGAAPPGVHGSSQNHRQRGVGSRFLLGFWPIARRPDRLV